MRASPYITFILLSGIAFGLTAAATSWINGANLWFCFAAYVLGGNVGVSLAAALVFFRGSSNPD
ncbi:MAG: hypothetical protein AAGF50_14190 [Pseudomonadota bacterium]